MGFFDSPNKFIIETAIDVGIDNVKKSQNLSPEALKSEYDKAKKALVGGNESEEIQALYKKFIEMYDRSISDASRGSQKLSEEIQWKHLGDLKEAVKNGGKGLSSSDIEGLNRYALVEYARQERMDIGHRNDEIQVTLQKWFQIYQTIQPETREVLKSGFKEALKKALLSAPRFPFDFGFTFESGKNQKVKVDTKANTLTIGSKVHTFISDNILINTISLDAGNLYMKATGLKKGEKEYPFSVTMTKKEFIDRYLDDILEGRTIKIKEEPVRVLLSGEYTSPSHSSGADLPEPEWTPAPTRNPETQLYSLEVARGYAIQELLKYGKTMKDFKEALNKKVLNTPPNLDTNTDFDQATYDALIQFQNQNKARLPITFSKGKPDGLVGPETLGLLFGVPAPASRPAPTERREGRPVPPNNPSAPSSPNRPSESSETLSHLFWNVEKAYIAFMKEAEASDIWFAGARKSEGQVQTEQKSMMEKQSLFQKAIGEYLSAGGSTEKINHFRLNLAYYYSNDLKGVNNTTNVNPQIAQGVLLSVLGNKIKSVPSAEASLFDALSSIANTPLGNMIAEQVKKKNITSINELFPILANPAVKGGWDEAYNKILDKQLKELDSSIDALSKDESKLSPMERKALDHLRDMRGKNGWWDLKTENREQMWQMLRYGSAIGGGILVASGIGSLGGAPLLALSASALTGAAATTGLTLLAQGYYTSTNDSLGEFSINLISFGAGAVVFKVASGLRSAAKLGKVTGGILTVGEMGASVAIGVGTDKLRAQLKGVDLDTWNSIQQNLIWAALPLAFRQMKRPVPKLADETAKKVETDLTQAQLQSALGKPATEELKKVKEGLAVLKAEGENAGVVLNAPMPPAPKSELKVPNWGEIPLNSNYKLHVAPDGTSFKIQDLSKGELPPTNGFPIGQLDSTLTALNINAPHVHEQIRAHTAANAPKNSSAAPRSTATQATSLDALTKQEITATDVRRWKRDILDKKQGFPQFIAEDGSVWTIRKVTRRNGPDQMVEIGPLGGPSVRNVHIGDFVDEVNANVRRFRAQPEASSVNTPPAVVPSATNAPSTPPIHGAEPLPPPATAAATSTVPKAQPAPTSEPVIAAPKPAPETVAPTLEAAQVVKPATNSKKPVHLSKEAVDDISHDAAKTVNQHIAKFTDAKAVKLAWDLATKELNPGGLIKSVLVFPANIIRLPLINARKIAEQWITKGDKGFQFTDGELLEKMGNSAKIAATASSKPFEGKTQGFLTLLTMGTVAWMTYEEIRRANPNSPMELTWGAAISFLKNMNFGFPIEFADWFFSEGRPNNL